MQRQRIDCTVPLSYDWNKGHCLFYCAKRKFCNNEDKQKEITPSIKQLFSRENLTTYIEATRHKTLFEEAQK